MNFENLIDFPLEDLENFNFDNKFFPNHDSLGYLDQYLSANFIESISTINKSNLLKLSKVIVNSLSFLLICEFENTEKYKNRWDLLSDLCEQYIEAKSSSIAFSELSKINDNLQRYSYSSLVINHLYNNKVAKISDIEKLLGTRMQYVTNLMTKFEQLGVITKSTIGKNKLVRLSSIGLDIYNKFIKNTNLDKNFDKKEYLQAFEDEEIKQEITSSSVKLLPAIA